VYRTGKGNGVREQGEFELIAAGVVDEESLLGQLGQAGTKGGGAHGAVVAEFLEADGPIQLGEGLANPLLGLGRRGRGCGRVGRLEGQGRAGVGEVQEDVVLRRGGAMFGG